VSSRILPDCTRQAGCIRRTADFANQNLPWHLRSGGWGPRWRPECGRRQTSRMWKQGVASAAGLPLRYDLRSTQGASSGEGNGKGRVGAFNIVFQHSPGSYTQACIINRWPRSGLPRHVTMRGQNGALPGRRFPQSSRVRFHGHPKEARRQLHVARGGSPLLCSGPQPPRPVAASRLVYKRRRTAGRQES